MRRDRDKVIAALLGLACGGTCGLAQDGRPQDEGPVIVGADAPRWTLLEPARFELGVELYGRARSDTTQTQGEEKVTDTELLLRETLNVNFEAYLGHKNFIDLSGNVRLGLEERWLDYESARESDQNTDFTNLFDLNALVFGASDLPITLYARRDQQYLDRDFASSIVDTVTEVGIRGHYQSDLAPTTVHLFYNDNQQDDLSSEDDYGSRQYSASLQNALRFSDNHRLETNYTYDNIDETLQNGVNNPYQRSDLLLTDIYTFGETRQNEARTYLRYYDQTGTSGFRSLRLEEQLRLIHSRTLETRYNVRAEKLERGGIDQTLINGFGTVTHRLFDSLVSTGTVGGEYFDTSENFRSNSEYVRGSLDYTKRAGPGRIDAAAGAGVNAQHNSDRGGTVSVVDQQLAYNDPSPITINQRNVVEGSVTVSGPGGLPTYVEGIDYTITYFPDRVEIYPILGGGITNGSSVLVDYSIGPEPASDITTYEWNASFRYTFTEGLLNGLSVYTFYRSVNQNLTAADPSAFALDDSQTLIYGTEYRRDWLRLQAEREHRQSTQNPYDVTRFQATGDYPLGLASRVAVQADYEIQDYSMPANHVDFWRLSARWNQRWGRELDTLLRADLRDERSDAQGHSTGLDGIFTIRWTKRQTTMYGTIRFTVTGTAQTDTRSQLFEFGLTRAF